MSEGHNWEIIGNLLSINDTSISIDKIEEYNALKSQDNQSH